jgi:hypothetical protein
VPLMELGKLLSVPTDLGIPTGLKGFHHTPPCVVWIVRDFGFLGFPHNRKLYPIGKPGARKPRY